MKRWVIGLVVVGSLSACPPQQPPRAWAVVASGLDEAVTSVSGSSAADVWAVGADVGNGPLVLHFDGTAWSRVPAGTKGNLWWSHTFSNGTALFGGTRGTILLWDGRAMKRQVTPGLARQTVFGIWGATPDDVWAVGAGTSGRRGFLWHFDGTEWSETPLPADVPVTNVETPGLFKVWGSGANDVWAVGGDGLVLHKGAAGWERRDLGRHDTLLTVGGGGGRVYISGGGSLAALLELDGTTWQDVSPTSVGLLQGVAGSATDAWASGEHGALFERTSTGWAPVNSGLGLDIESLHSVWVDPAGNVWAAGGNVLTTLNKGALIRFAVKAAPGYVQPEKPRPPDVVCPTAAIDPAEGQSIARRWNEQVLNAIRRDLPRPTVHARNLYHLSAAMWDVWASYDTAAKGVFSQTRTVVAAADLEPARMKSLSYAAYRLLDHRYATAVGGPETKACLKAFMNKLGYSPDDVSTAGDSPAAVGNRIGQAVIDATQNDGANETNNYADTTGFSSVAAALSVETPGPAATDIDLWQPLDLAIAATQNGIPLAPGVQKYVGAHWGLVTPFSMVRPGPGALYVDPGAPPKLTALTMPSVVELILRSSQLEKLDETIDISPGAYGNNPLGSNSGTGRPLNPVTGQAYAPQRVPLGDFGRVLAEVWADGPSSETPPGHWNVIANQVFASASFVRKWRGTGAVLSPLDWDVRASLALNGAVHDAAIAAWELKRASVCSRPITLIRSSAAHGQSSDSSKPGYDARGLPLVDDLIELVTAQSAAIGGRHAGFQNAVGQVVIRAWRGEPGDTHRTAGIGWVRGVEWVPYQKRDFVTPAFPGFVSGHSTFSRAAAVVMSQITGSEFFPGGLGELPVAANTSLRFELGPTQPVVLQWATYFDAADQAGQSRIWGGIHIQADDFAGRRVGAQVGQTALLKAETYFQ